jgi:hypothetical protein
MAGNPCAYCYSHVLLMAIDTGKEVLLDAFEFHDIISLFQQSENLIRISL